MKKCLLAVMAIAVFGQISSAQIANGNVVGRWRSVETSKGGIGAMYEFQADGAILFSPGAIVEMPYRLEGDQLIFPSDTTTGPEQKATITWNGNDLFQQTVNGQDGGTFRRQGAASDAGGASDARTRLVGEWLGSREMDGRKMEMRMIFDPGGKLLLLIKFTTQQGTYSIANGRLVAKFNGAIGLDGPVTLANGELAIARNGGRITRLKRY